MSDPAVKTHSVNIFHKILATGLSVAKTSIKYKSNNLEENEEEEEEEEEEDKEPINIELTEQTDPYNDENAIDFR